MTTSTHTMVSSELNERSITLRQFIAAFMSAWLAFSPLVTLRAAYAGPIADGAAPASSRPQVTATPSGVPLVNIAAPNAAGASYNRYQRFDVDGVGLILNNSTRAASSQLGGQIGANPHFSGRSANLIVNEVTSAIPSTLNGPLAVFGDAAKLIIANPNGVTCNGCGFLNTPQVQLTTGRVQFLTAPGGALTLPENGSAVAFDVRGGTLRVEGQGLASPLERLDLIAQTLSIDGPVSVTGALKLLAGRQWVASDDLTVSANGAINTRAAIQTDDPAAGDFAVDATVLGAMTAGSIRIVAPPAGMGVRADSRLAATAGDLLISADGEVRIKDMYAARDLRLAAAALDNTGGHIHAGNALTLDLDTLTLGVPQAGALHGEGRLAINVAHFDNSGEFTHAAPVAIAASASFSNTGRLSGGSDITLRAQGLLANSGEVNAAAVLDIDAQAGMNNSGTLQGGSLGLACAVGCANDGGKLLARGDLTATIEGLSNAGGLISAAGMAVLSLDAASGNAGGIIEAGTLLALVTPKTSGLGGTLASGLDVALSFNDMAWDTGDILAGRDIRIDAANFSNAVIIGAPQDLNVSVSGNLANTGQLLAGRDIGLSAASFTNTAGIVEAGRDLSIRADSVLNQRGPLTSVYTNYGDYSPPGSVNCRADHGYCESWQQVESTPAAVLSARRGLSIGGLTHSASVTNDASLLTAGDIVIEAASFTNAARTLTTSWHGHWREWRGTLRGYRDHDEWGVSVSGSTAAVAQAAGNVSIAAASQSNSGLIQGASVYLGGDSLTNGLTNYRYQTPAATLPAAVIDLGAMALPPGVKRAPDAPTLLQSGLRLALLTPLAHDYLLDLLPPEARASSAPFYADALIESQLLRQAALDQSGRASFLQSGEGDPRAALYRNAAQAAREQGLKLGLALSDEQIQQLDAPILWYVERDTEQGRALVPVLYLPQVSREQLVKFPGGVISGADVALRASDTVRNTGYIDAGDLAIDAASLVNEKRSADIGEIHRHGEGGYLKLTGDTVQPGGFISAARMQIAAGAVHSISGEFIEDGQDISGQLAERLGANYTYTQNEDHIRSEWVQVKTKDGLEQVAVMAVAIAVAVYTGGAAAGALGFAEGTMGYAVASASIGGMASTAVTGALNGNFDLNNVLKSGLTAAATAGLTQWAGQALGNTTLTQTQQVGDAVKAGQTASQFTDELVGYTVRAGVTAGVNQAVYGKQAGSFGTAFVQSFVAAASADAANWVGGNTQPQSVQNIASHALIGCAAAAATGKDCGAGAIGGATAAALNPLLDHLTSNDDKVLRDAQLAALSTAASGLVADVLGQDIGTAVNAAQNETLNNYLTRSQKSQMFKELNACSGLACKAQVYARHGVVSTQQDVAFASGVLIGATGRAAEMGVETVQGIGKIVEDIPGTFKALKDFVANLDADQVKKIGAETVADYKRRVDLFEQNYQTGGWRGAQDAGIELGALVVDGALLATGIGGAARLTVKLGVGMVEKVGVATTRGASAEGGAVSRAAGGESVVAKSTSKELTTFFPPNNGFLGSPTNTVRRVNLWVDCHRLPGFA